MPVQQKVRVGVVGATGYAGAELVRILLGHPGVDLTYISASTDGPGLTAFYPNLISSALPALEAFDIDRAANASDCVFVCLPSGVSGNVAVNLWKRGRKVIDLSGDLRLPADVYQAWYHHDPVECTVQSAAVYGLTEWHTDAVRQATLVANPGCYATAILLGLMPLASAGWLDGQTVHIDAKSGVSGAGRAAKLPYALSELDDNFYAYKVAAHQHTPEIEQAIEHRAPVLLTTQLLPTVRGIYACMYIPWNQDVSVNQIQGRFSECYTHQRFVHVLDTGVPQLKSVRGSNACHISWHVDERTRTLLVMSAIDNLQKGAAGQAVQNFNWMYEFSEQTALTAHGLFP